MTSVAEDKPTLSPPLPPREPPRGQAALDDVTASPVDVIRYFDTPLYCHFIGTDATRQVYHGLLFPKQTLLPQTVSAAAAAADLRARDDREDVSGEAARVPPAPEHHFDGRLSFRTTQYSPAEAHSLMETLSEQPGVRTGRLRAILGCVRFLEGYYVIGAVQRRLVARIGPHRIFAMGDVELLSLTIDPQRLQSVYETAASATTASRVGPSAAAFSISAAASYIASAVAASSSALYTRRPQEERYREQFLSQHAQRTFFYSHTYDLTNTLQVNMTTVTCAAEGSPRGPDAETHGVEETVDSDSDAPGSAIGTARAARLSRHRRLKYAWNEFFLEPFLADEGVGDDSDDEGGSNSDDNHSWVSSRGDTSNSSRSSSMCWDSVRDTASWPSSRRRARRRTDFAGSENLVFSSPQFAQVWVVYMIRGAIVQRTLQTVPSQRCLLLTLIARVSKESAGTRYLRRGVNSDGHVANHVEVEQILHDEGSLCHRLTQGSFSSYVQVRGSVPLRWYHPPSSSLPKPAIVIAEADTFHNASCKHFQELLADYGAPIVAMDFLKQNDKRNREGALGQAYRSVVGVLRHAVNEANGVGGSSNAADAVLRYRAIDLRHVADRAWNAVTAAAERDCRDVMPFACRADGSVVQLQDGVVRSNCVDCIDRTNIGQFFFSLHALGQQLAAMQLLGHASDAVVSHGVAEVLLGMFLALGDAIATQYGGSAQVGAGVLHRGRGWDQVMGIKRFYANIMGDTRKQFVLNLYLGRLQPSARLSAGGVLRARGSRMCNQHMRLITVREARRGGGDRTVLSASSPRQERGLASTMPSLVALDAQLIDGSAGTETDVASEDRRSLRQPSVGNGTQEHDGSSTVDDAQDADGGPASLSASLYSTPSVALTARVTPRQSLVQRLRNVRLNPFTATTPFASAEVPGSHAASATGRPRKADTATGDAEPDYYLQVKTGPELPSPSLLQCWWKPPLGYRKKCLAMTARRQPPVVDPRAIEPSSDRYTIVWRERAFSVAPPCDDSPAVGQQEPNSEDAEVSLFAEEVHLSDHSRSSQGARPILFETICVGGGINRAAADATSHASGRVQERLTPWAALAAACSQQPPPYNKSVSHVTSSAGAPVKPVEFTHDHAAFPHVVGASVYARQQRQRDEAPSEPSPWDDSSLTVVGAVCSLFGPFAEWSCEHLCDALYWAVPQVSRATLDAIRCAQLTGSAIRWPLQLPPALRALHKEQQDLLVGFLSALARYTAAQKSPDPPRAMEEGKESARLWDGGSRGWTSQAAAQGSSSLNEREVTARFLQPFFEFTLGPDNVLDALHDWKTHRLLHPTFGLSHRTTRYRFAEQFYHALSTGSGTRSSSGNAPSQGHPSPSASGTPPVPLAMAIQGSFAARELVEWLLGVQQQAPPASAAARISFHRFLTPRARRRAAWSFSWWLLVAGVVKPVVSPLSSSGAAVGGTQAWELLADATALSRVDGCERRQLGSGDAEAADDFPSIALNSVPSPAFVVEAPTALAESLCSAALSALTAVSHVPLTEPAAFVDIAASLITVLGEGAAALRAVAVTAIPAEELLSFWVNVYNALYVHAWLRTSVPLSTAGRSVAEHFRVSDEHTLSFYKQHGYLIGSYCFTLYDIKYGLLCGNQPALSECLPPFPPALYAQALHKLTPPQLRVGTGGDGSEDELRTVLLLADAERRARIEDGTSTGERAMPRPTPQFASSRRGAAVRASSDALKQSLAVAQNTLQEDRTQYLLPRTLLALLDVYVPLPLALSRTTPLSGAASGTHGFSVTHTAAAASIPEHTYARTMTQLMGFLGTGLDASVRAAREPDAWTVFGADLPPPTAAGDEGLPVLTGAGAPLSRSFSGVAVLPLPPSSLSPDDRGRRSASGEGNRAGGEAASPVPRALPASAPSYPVKDMWSALDTSNCLYMATVLHDEAASSQAYSLNSALEQQEQLHRHSPPRRVYLKSFQRMDRAGAEHEWGTTAALHLCEPLFPKSWEDTLLHVERGFLNAVQHAQRGPQVAELLSPLLVGQPQSAPLGETTSQALHRLQQSQRSGRHAKTARDLLSEGIMPASPVPASSPSEGADGWLEWRQRLGAFAASQAMAPCATHEQSGGGGGERERNASYLQQSLRSPSPVAAKASLYTPTRTPTR